MKSKTTLSLIEQIIMLAVFAIAATAVLKVFVYAETLSGKKEVQSFAVAQSQNAAEAVKAAGGDMEAAARLVGAKVQGEGFEISYDEELNLVSRAGCYTLKAEPPEELSPGIGEARITFLAGDEIVYELRVCWQEEMIFQ